MSALAYVLAASLLLPVVHVDESHTVVPGDTLSEIAKSYNTTLQNLIEANEVDDPDLIVVGEVLRIPGQHVTHRVQPGETLGEIAAKYGTTVARLAAANGIVNVDRIFAGSELAIADGAGTLPDSAGVSTPEPAPAPEIGTGPAAYVVAAGDTLAEIAYRHDTTVGTLIDLNGLADANLIRVGQRLVVPGTGFVCPVPGAGYINDWHFPRPGGRIHLGTDLFAPHGTPVLAPVSGLAEHIDGTLGGLQYWLHGDDGNLYIGTHMSGFGLDGRVQAGDVLGYVGQTGNARGTPPHLHFEIVVAGEEVNPYLVLQANGC